MTSPQLNQPKTRLIQAGWVTVILVALSAAVGQAFGRFSYGVLLPAVRDDLGITNTLAGLIGAANVGAYLLGTLIVAWATSHYRLINVMRVGLILATLGLLLASLSSSPWLLAMALFVAGIGGAFLWIPAPVIAADALPPHRRRIAVGLMSSGIGLGVMFVSILSGSLRSSQGDGAWSEVYQIQFLIGLALLALVMLIVRHEQTAPSGGAGIGGVGALRRMPGWLPIIVAYSTFGFMYLLVLGFLTTRLEDDSLWTTQSAASTFSAMGFAMIFGGPTFVTLAHKIGVRLALATAFGLWPIFVGIVITGYPTPTLLACIGLGFLFSALPTLITLYVVENTTVKDYGPSFAAATLAFGIAQTISPPIGGYLADLTGSFTLVFMLAALMSVIGLLATLKLPRNAL